LKVWKLKVSNGANAQKKKTEARRVLRRVLVTWFLSEIKGSSFFVLLFSGASKGVQTKHTQDLLSFKIT